jgi:hypothetical protein
MNELDSPDDFLGPLLQTLAESLDSQEGPSS